MRVGEIHYMGNSVTYSVLAVPCAVRPQSNSVLFPGNYLTDLEISRVLPLQEKYTVKIQKKVIQLIINIKLFKGY